MDDERRRALAALEGASVAAAVERLVEVGVLDESLLRALRDEQLHAWRTQATDELGDQLEALRRQARHQRRRAEEQAREARRQRAAAEAAREAVVRLDVERRARSKRDPEESQLADAAAALDAAHRALGAALAAKALLDDRPAHEASPPPRRVSGLTLREQRIGDRVCVEVSGEIDLATAPALSEALASAMASGAADIWVDLTGVCFIDSTGISALLTAHQRLRPNRRLAIVCPDGAVRRILNIAGVDRTLDVFGDRASADVTR